MRVADKMIFGQINDTLHKGRTGMSDALNKAATQKRVNKPSDDPLAAARVLSFRTDDLGNRQFLKVLANARAAMDFSEQSLGELTEVLSRAKELSLQAVNDASSNPQSRRVVAAEISQLYGQAIKVGNRKLAGKFIFGGFKTTTKPFDKNGIYLGDSGEIHLPIEKGTKVAINVPGSVVFLGNKRWTAENQEELPNSKTPGTAISDEGAPEKNTIDGGGQDPQMRGPASIGTLASVEVPPQDGPNIRADKKEALEFEKIEGVNIFKLLKKLEVALLVGDKLTIQNSLESLDKAADQVVLARADLGARLSNLNATYESLEKSKVDNKAAISQLEDVDAFEAVSEVNKAETTLKASLATSGKLIQPSLLDFLR